ncbi:hypothetical protein F8S20_13355, partial [Nostoc sp. BAE]|nr:hypothetical protein [Nostoc commune BAE]
MKPRLHDVTTFNLKLMGVMPVVALNLVLYPTIVKAQPVNQNLFFSDSPSQVDKGVEDQADQNKVAEKSTDSNSPHLLESSEQKVPPTSTSSALTTDTLIPDIQRSETEVQPFQPANSVDLPRGLRKIAGIEEKTEVQPFQPANSVDLPRGLRKIA